MLIFNELTSLIVLDLFTNLLRKYIVPNMHRKPNTISLGYASSLLREWKSWNIIGDSSEKESNMIAPQLPILSLIPNDLQPDQQTFPWRKLTTNNFQRAYTTLYLVKTPNFRISYSPYLYILRMSLVYVGTSFADVTDCKIRLEEVFGVRHVIEEPLTTTLILPIQPIEDFISTDVLQNELQQYMKKVVVPLIAEERYVIPFQLRYFARLVGQSDNSQLFGEEELPKYMVSYDFEITANLPTKVNLEYGGKIITIDTKYRFPMLQHKQQESKDESCNDILQLHDFEIDSKTGSFIIHSILKCNS